MIKQIKSFQYAFEGIWYTIRNEAHMRFHIVIAIYVLSFGALYALNIYEWAILIVVISLVIGLELVNTAMERLCNLYSKEIHPLIKIIKDVSAGAVLISAFGSVGVACFIFIKPDKISQIFFMFLQNPLYAAIFIVSIILSILFVLKFHPKKEKTYN